MKVSVICPTYQRPERHANLYTAFNQQTYKDKELLIMDDSTVKSPFFSNLQDDRVVYRFLSSHYSIGHKRNLLVDLAKGEIIMHFDDDDYYAPDYIQTMVDAIQEADFVKLSKWLAWQEVGGRLWEWDANCPSNSFFTIWGNGKIQKFANISPEHMQEVGKAINTNLGCYGFSHVYRKSVWDSTPFEDLSSSEDILFVKYVKQSGKICKQVSPASHLILHTLHAQSSSRIHPHYYLDASLAVQLLGEKVKPWLISYPQNT